MTLLFHSTLRSVSLSYAFFHSYSLIHNTNTQQTYEEMLADLEEAEGEGAAADEVSVCD